MKVYRVVGNHTHDGKLKNSAELNNLEHGYITPPELRCRSEGTRYVEGLCVYINDSIRYRKSFFLDFEDAVKLFEERIKIASFATYGKMEYKIAEFDFPEELLKNTFGIGYYCSRVQKFRKSFMAIEFAMNYDFLRMSLARKDEEYDFKGRQELINYLENQGVSLCGIESNVEGFFKSNSLVQLYDSNSSRVTDCQENMHEIGYISPQIKNGASQILKLMGCYIRDFGRYNGIDTSARKEVEPEVLWNIITKLSYDYLSLSDTEKFALRKRK